MTQTGTSCDLGSDLMVDCVGSEALFIVTLRFEEFGELVIKI